MQSIATSGIDTLAPRTGRRPRAAEEPPEMRQRISTMGLMPVDPPPIAETERYVKSRDGEMARLADPYRPGGYAVKVASMAVGSLASTAEEVEGAKSAARLSLRCP